jgi:hypothetical protein
LYKYVLNFDLFRSFALGVELFQTADVEIKVGWGLDSFNCWGPGQDGALSFPLANLEFPDDNLSLNQFGLSARLMSLRLLASNLEV